MYGKLAGCDANLVYLCDEGKVEGNILAIKHLDKCERHELLRNASLLVCPRRHSGFESTMLEAMALGCPVLASNTGSALEFIENGRTGFLLTNKTQLWADKITAILSSQAGTNVPQANIFQTIVAPETLTAIKRDAREHTQSLCSERLFREVLLEILRSI